MYYVGSKLGIRRQKENIVIIRHVKHIMDNNKQKCNNINIPEQDNKCIT